MRKHILVTVTLSFIFCLAVVGQTTVNSMRPKIQRITSKLRHEGILHLGAPVGFAGIPETNNIYYKLYQKLNSKATDDELVMLINEESKAIVLYSFLILCSRHYSGLKEIFLQNIKDTSEVWIAGGCTGSTMRVNLFMLRQLNPAHIQQPYLSQKEYDKYMKEFGETD